MRIDKVEDCVRDLSNRWLCITNEDNWNVVKTKKVWGVPEKRGKHQIESVRPGDKLVFYVTPKRIAGIFEATSKPFESKEKIFGWADFGREEYFPHRVKLKSVILAKEPVSADAIMRELSFSKGQKYWSICLRRAMLKITESDFDALRRLLLR
jgi:predicted RNA-binding protein